MSERGAGFRRHTSPLCKLIAETLHVCLLCSKFFLPKYLVHLFYWSNALSLITPHCIVLQLGSISYVKVTLWVCVSVLQSGCHFDGLLFFSFWDIPIEMIDPALNLQSGDSFYLVKSGMVFTMGSPHQPDFTMKRYMLGL